MQRVKIWNYLSSKLSNEISYGMCYVEDLSEISAAYCEVQILALCSILFYLILSNPVMTLNLDRGWFPSWRDETP